MTAVGSTTLHVDDPLVAEGQLVCARPCVHRSASEVDDLVA
jgi:hypothetical protein